LIAIEAQADTEGSYFRAVREKTDLDLDRSAWKSGSAADVDRRDLSPCDRW